MARVCESAIVDVPIEEVWRWLRDFNSHWDWHPAIAESEIENGLPADSVGACARLHPPGRRLSA
ncbi:SRPBCC family protein [uncultured Roseibium sp.]|uniref:SRPBCC family protein n=1 Tax=uncultured Roseibium sp. TaxID=1936171 RepID=UPI0032173632